MSGLVLFLYGNCLVKGWQGEGRGNSAESSEPESVLYGPASGLSRIPKVNIIREV